MCGIDTRAKFLDAVDAMRYALCAMRYARQGFFCASQAIFMRKIARLSLLLILRIT